MDECSSRRPSGGHVTSRKGPSLVPRDSAENSRDRNVQVCSRVGCSSRLNSMKDAQVGSLSRVKTPKTPFRSSSHGKESIGSSSKTPASVNTSRKSFSESRKKLPSHLETDLETCSLQDEAEEVSRKTWISLHPELEDHKHVEVELSEEGSSSSGPTNRFVKRNNHRFGLGRQDSVAGSSGLFPFKQANQGARNVASSSRSNLRHLKCKSISDVIPTSSSPVSTESNLGRKRDTGGRKRIGEPESSLSSRGKKLNGPMLDEGRNDFSNRGISISGSRRATNSSSSGNDENSSGRTQRSSARTRLSNPENRNRSQLVESSPMNPSSPQLDISTDASAFSLGNQFSAQTRSNHVSSFSRPGSSGERMRPNRSISPYEVGFARSFMNRDTLRQYNLDGIAEMLLALERIEQEEEPSYEQLLLLETNFFLGGLAFHDQHRDMRLDIDNMSYEELLALEERMGTVSTAVPEEVLVKCLKRSIYQETTDCRDDEDDIKCSICQEEYADGDEVGRLSCDHKYHFECINQWLGLKNWCPICKASAAPSPSPSASPPF